MLAAGNLRHQVTIRNVTLAPSADGTPVPSATTDVAGIWADIRPATANEILKGQELGHVVSHAITMRYRADVTSASQILFGARTFQIASVLNIEERNTELRIYAKETT